MTLYTGTVAGIVYWQPGAAQVCAAQQACQQGRTQEVQPGLCCIAAAPGTGAAHTYNLLHCRRERLQGLLPACGPVLQLKGLHQVLPCQVGPLLVPVWKGRAVGHSHIWQATTRGPEEVAYRPCSGGRCPEGAGAPGRKGICEHWGIGWP